MNEQNYFTAYDKNGNLIKYATLADVPFGKQSGALTEQVYRMEGLTDYVERYNNYRRKIAMEE